MPILIITVPYCVLSVNLCFTAFNHAFFVLRPKPCDGELQFTISLQEYQPVLPEGSAHLSVSPNAHSYRLPEPFSYPRQMHLLSSRRSEYSTYSDPKACVFYLLPHHKLHHRELSLVYPASVTNFNNDDNNFCVSDFSKNTIITNPVSPIITFVDGQSLSVLSWICCSNQVFFYPCF